MNRKIREMRKLYRPTQAIVLALTIGLMTPLAVARGMTGGEMMGENSSNTPAHTPSAVNQYGCMSCHAIDQRKIGPAFSWVAWKYKNEPDASTRVSAFIEHGGSGPWGGLMPDLNVSPAQARQIARWILSLPPQTPPGS